MEARRKEPEAKKEPTPVEQVVTHWNGVVDSMINARYHWNEMQKILQTIPREAMQFAPVHVQKATAKFKKAKFEVMVDRFVEHYRGFGGLDAMKVKGA